MVTDFFHEMRMVFGEKLGIKILERGFGEIKKDAVRIWR